MTQPSQDPFIGITIEALLRPCAIYPVGAQGGAGFLWEWSALEGEARSGQAFEMFFDCLEDARASGYEPHFLDGRADLSVVPVLPRAS